MQAQEQLNRVNEFIEENIWYIQSIMKENQNQGVNHSKKGTQSEGLKTRLQTLQDIQSVMRGEL